MKLKNLLILFLVILTAVNIASAKEIFEVNLYSTDRSFMLSSPSYTVDVCQCNTFVDTVRITNSGVYSAIYNISLNQNFIVSDNFFELMPSQSKDVFIYITAPCDAEKSTKFLVTVGSNLGKTQTIEKQLNFNKCQNLKLWMYDLKKEVEPCQKNITYKLGIQNVGVYTEQYQLGMDDYGKYILFSENSFYLEPNQSKEVYAILNLPCSIYGNKTLTFTAYAVNNKLTASIKSNLTIKRDYEYTTTVIPKYEACEKVYNSYQIMITNTGIVENSYNLKLDKPIGMNYVALDTYNFTLKPNKSIVVNLTVDLINKDNLDNKKYNLTLHVIPSLGDLNKDYKFELGVYPCYVFGVKVIADKKEAKKTCSGYDYEYTVNLTNNGYHTENISLSLEGNPSGLSFSQNMVTLAPNTQKSVTLYVRGPETNYLYNIKVIAKLQNGLVESDSFKIQAYDKQRCHNVEFNVRKIYRTNYDGIVIPFILENKGIVDSTYNFKLSGTSIAKLNESSVFLTTNNKSVGHIVVKPVNKNITKEGYYGTDLIVSTPDGASYKKHIDIYVKDKSILRKWLESAYYYFVYTGKCHAVNFWLLLALLMALIILIYVKMNMPKYRYKLKNKIKAKTWELIILILVFVFAALVLIYFVGIPVTKYVYNDTTNETKLHFVWQENTNYRINLAKYFYDPDKDILSYTASKPNHINVVINGNTAVLVPPINWYGTDSVVFTASDKRGGFADSPIMTLEVIKRQHTSLADYIAIYCWYINLFVFLIILLVIFFIIVFRKKKEEEK